MTLLFLAAGLGGITAPPDAVPARAERFIRERLKLERYRAAAADLNGDHSLEIFVYADGQRRCGSGGCTLFILTPDARSYRIVTRLTVTRPPIRVLEASTHGWNDLGVRVAGGGIQAYEARLRFDGRAYPSNPTVAPAVPAGNARGLAVLE